MDFKKILKISLFVIFCVAIIYLIVGTFFMGESKSSAKFNTFGSSFASANKSASNISTDELEVSMDKVLINLNKGKFRYMKSDMSFKMRDDANKERLKEAMPYIRDAVLRYSASRDSDKLATDAGKQEYKEDLMNLISDKFGIEIDQVYFKSFVLAK